MAEHPWYEKHRKDVAAALKKAKAAPKEDALSCSLVKMADASHLICIHINAGKATALVKEAKAGGGKVVSAGRLFLGNEGPTFEVDVGDLTVKPKFALAAAAVGMPMNNVIVKAAEAPPAPPAPPAAAVPPPAGGPDFKTRVAGLATAVKQAPRKFRPPCSPTWSRRSTSARPASSPRRNRIWSGWSKGWPAPPPRRRRPRRPHPPRAPRRARAP